MSTYFFYGTLQDPEIAREILGRPLSGCSPQSCVLKGYKRVYVADATYPAILADAGSDVAGLLVSRISPLEASRLSRYEGKDYKVEELDVILKDGNRQPASVFVPLPALRLTNRLWELNTWRRYEKRRFLAGLRRNVLV